MTPESYLIEINNIDVELKRINQHAKNLRAQKAKTMNGLHQYMVSHNLEQVTDGKKTISLNKFEPKKKAKSKPKKQKRNDTLQLFRDVGIPNPEQFYEELETIQKIVPKENEQDDNDIFKSQKTKRNKKKDSIDPFLGF